MKIITKILLSTALLASFSATSSATLYSVTADGKLTEIANGSVAQNGTEYWSTGKNEYLTVGGSEGNGMSTRLPLSKNHAYFVRGNVLKHEATLSTKSLNSLYNTSKIAGATSGGISGAGGPGGTTLLTIAGLAAAIAAVALIAKDKNDVSP